MRDRTKICCPRSKTWGRDRLSANFVWALCLWPLKGVDQWFQPTGHKRGQDHVKAESPLFGDEFAHSSLWRGSICLWPLNYRSTSPYRLPQETERRVGSEGYERPESRPEGRGDPSTLHETRSFTSSADATKMSSSVALQGFMPRFQRRGRLYVEVEYTCDTW